MELQQFGEEKLRMFSSFNEIKQLVEKFEVRDDDVFIAAFPKQGTCSVNKL